MRLQLLNAGVKYSLCSASPMNDEANNVARIMLLKTEIISELSNTVQ